MNSERCNLLSYSPFEHPVPVPPLIFHSELIAHFPSPETYNYKLKTKNFVKVILCIE